MLRFNIFKLFSLETAGPLCTYVIKTLKNLLVWNQKADYLETWNAVSANRLLLNLFKWWRWYDLNLFYGKVIFVPLWWEKDKNNIFSIISKLVDAVNQMSAWIIINIKGQGHSLIFIQGHSGSTFSNFFSLETLKQIEAKFRVKTPCDRGMNVSTTGLCHMTITAAISIYCKKL